MRLLFLLSLFLSISSVESAPVAVISSHHTESDISYSVPTIPFDGTTSIVRLKIKAQSHKPKQSQLIGNYPLKIKSVKIYLNGKKLKLAKKIEDQLPLLSLSIEGSLNIIPLNNRSIRIQFNTSGDISFLDITAEGIVEHKKPKMQNKPLRPSGK